MRLVGALFDVDQKGFNPRPPLPGSDARMQGAIRVRLIVSIHAPRCRGAMQEKVINTAKYYRFQSTPPVAGERCPMA